MQSENFKAVVLIWAKPELCIERIVRRDGLTREQALARLDSQMDIEEKKKFPGVILVENSSTFADLKKSCKSLLRKAAQTIILEIEPPLNL